MCRPVFNPQRWARPSRNEPGAGPLTWKKRKLSLLLWNCSKRFKHFFNHQLTHLIECFFYSPLWLCVCPAAPVVSSEQEQFQGRDEAGGTGPVSPVSLLRAHRRRGMSITKVCCCCFYLWGFSLTSSRPADPRLQSQAALWRLPRMLRLLGQRRLVGSETSRLVREEWTQAVIAQR